MSKTISQMNSLRLASLRFPLIVLVIYIHARSGTITFGDSAVSFNSDLVNTIKHIVSDGIARTAVPLFFLLSGYLLFFGQERWSWPIFRTKLRRRFDTLLVPYLFWNLALYVILAVAQATSLRVFFSASGILRDLSWHQQISWVIGLQRYPINYQFWFIRDLMVVVLAGPLFFVIGQRKPIAYAAIAGLALCWVLNLWQIDIPAIEAVLFFFIGVFAGVHGKDIFDGPPIVPVAIGYIGLLTGFALTLNTAAEPFVQHALVGMGIFLALGVARNSPPRLIQPIASLSGASFFVFAVHEPLTTTLLKLSYRLFPVSSGMALTVYLLVPIIVIGFSLVLYRIFLTLAPAFTRRVTGR